MIIKDKNLYYIGGVVRDEILNKPSFDIDFCYEGNAIEFAQGLNITKTNPDFGTVRIKIDDTEIDIASTRTESYPKAGHLPVVEKIGCTLKEDLSRRDFTINALAKNTVTGEITDYFNGLEDIKNKKIRILHKNSFIDDPSRIIRGLKFSVRFDFDLDTETKKLQDEYLKNINYDLSFHRLKKELKETFNLNKEEAFEKFINQNIYKLLGPNQTVPKIKTSIEALVNKYNPENIWLVYLGLFDLSNFELTSDEKEIITNYDKIKNFTPQNDVDIYNTFKKVPLESILLYALNTDSNIAKKYLDILQNYEISTTGADLQKLGVKSGPLYKEILSFIQAEKINNPKITAKDEIELIKGRYL